MRLPIASALRSAGRFVARNPMSLLKVARHAVGMRIAVPLDAIRWFVTNIPMGDKAPTDVRITARPPAIHLSGNIEVMGSKIKAATAIKVEHLQVEPEVILLRLRMNDTDLKVLDESMTPISGLIRSGALDLSKPGNLVKFMPVKVDALVSANDDILEFDLMKVPKIANNYRLRRVLERLTPIIDVSVVETDGDFLILGLRPNPGGVTRALYPQGSN